MSYRYLDHEADVGLEARGTTAADALTAGIQGLLNLLVDTQTVRPAGTVTVTASAPDLGALFVALLNAVLAEQDINGMFFASFALESLESSEVGWSVRGRLQGEPIDLERHAVGNEVKAATYSGLQATERPGETVLRCVLDI